MRDRVPVVPALVAASAFAVLAGCRAGVPGGASLDDLRDRIPVSVNGWGVSGPGTVYDRESIFSYIDGLAEVYLAYGMRGCVARRYAGPAGEPDVVLDVFEMGSPDDAFGVFTHDQDGDPAGVGTGSLLRYGWLSFWKGRYFVSILAENDTPKAREAVLDLGRAVSALVDAAGSIPAVVAALPPAGLVPRSVRYLHDPQILRTHLPLDAEESFHLGPETPAALGKYRREADGAFLLLVDYGDAAAASRAGEDFRSRFLAGRGDGPARSGERGWFGIRVADRRIAAVMGATSETIARSLLEDAARSGPGGKS